MSDIEEVKSNELSNNMEQVDKKCQFKNYITSLNLIWAIIYLITIILGVCIWFSGRTVSISIDSTHIMSLCLKLICIAFQKSLTFIGIMGEVFVFTKVKGKFFTFYSTVSIIVIAVSILGIII